MRLLPLATKLYTLNCKLIFECLLLKNVEGPPSVPCGVYASKPWSFSSGCKNLRQQYPLGAQIWFSEKIDLRGSKLTCPTLFLVD